MQCQTFNFFYNTTQQNSEIFRILTLTVLGRHVLLILNFVIVVAPFTLSAEIVADTVRTLNVHFQNIKKSFSQKPLNGILKY